MEILLVLITGALCVTCFFVGAKVGQTVSNGERVELPKVDLGKAKRERQERKKEEIEQERYNTILENVERYDGTPSGQKDIPKY